MSALPSTELLKGAMRALGLATDGKTQEQLHSELGAHLVKQMLGASDVPHTSTPTHNERTRDRGDKPPKRSRSEWFAFLREEKPRVRQGMGLHDNVSVLREVARRWKIY